MVECILFFSLFSFVGLKLEGLIWKNVVYSNLTSESSDICRVGADELCYVLSSWHKTENIFLNVSLTLSSEDFVSVVLFKIRMKMAVLTIILDWCTFTAVVIFGVSVSIHYWTEDCRISCLDFPSQDNLK